MDSVHTNEAKILRYPRLPPFDTLRLFPHATRPPAGRDHSCHLHEPLRTLSNDPCGHTVHPSSLERYQAPRGIDPGRVTRPRSRKDLGCRSRPSAHPAPPNPQPWHSPGAHRRHKPAGAEAGRAGPAGLQNAPASNFRSWGRDQLTSGPAGADGTVDFQTRGRGEARGS